MLYYDLVIQNPEFAPEKITPADAMIRRLGAFGVEASMRDPIIVMPRFEGLNVSQGEIEKYTGDALELSQSPQVIAANQELIDQNDNVTLGHEIRVAIEVGIAAARMGATPDEITELMIAGLVHDNGKSKAQKVFQNSGIWTPDERREARAHPKESAKQLGNVGINSPNIIYYTERHHDELLPKPERDIAPYGGESVQLTGDNAARIRLFKQLFTRIDYIDATSGPRPRGYQEGTITPAEAIRNMSQDLESAPEIESLLHGMVAVPVAA